MSCDDRQIELMELAAGDNVPSGSLKDHIAHCHACTDAWDELVESMSLLEEIPGDRVPDAVAARVRAEIVDDLRTTREDRPSTLRDAAVAMLVGVGAAVASLGILGARVDLASQPAGMLVAGAAAWTAAFALVSWLILRQWRSRKSVRGAVTTALGALAAFLLADHLMPVTETVQFCYRSSTASPYLGVAGLQSLFFAVGAAYAAVPLFVFSFAAAKRRRPAPSGRGPHVAGAFFILVAPSIFLQCEAFTTGALLAWLGGAAVGAMAGSAGGRWANRRRPTI